MKSLRIFFISILLRSHFKLNFRMLKHLETTNHSKPVYQLLSLHLQWLVPILFTLYRLYYIFDLSINPWASTANFIACKLQSVLKLREC